MAEQVASTTPVTPTTTNGAPKGAPQVPSTPPPNSAAPAVPDASERIKSLEADYNKKTREQIVERRKWAAEKQTFGEKLKAADEYAQLQKHANVNPIAVAKKLWGDNWNQRLMEVQANGGAPTADSIAFELEQREAAFDKKLAAHDEAQRKAQSEAAAKQTQNEIRQIHSEIAAFGKANAAEFPLLMDRVGSDGAKFAGAVFQTIKNVYDSTTKRDENGELLEHGRTLTFKEAAESIENDLYAIAEKAHTFEKYTPKLREKLQPPKTSGTVSPVVKSAAVSSAAGAPSQQPQRRTLSNDLTGSTPSESPKHKTDAERLAAAMAKYEANARRG